MDAGGGVWPAARALADRFSYAGNGNSTYSFGLMQFDVGNNAAARAFLASIGFTSTQISMLSQEGGLSQTQLASLDAELQTPANLQALQAFTQQQLVDSVQSFQQSLELDFIADVNRKRVVSAALRPLG